MLVGINYPWLNCGWDFGDPPGTWVPEHRLPEWRENRRRKIEDDFRLFASQGLFAVRWFLLADGLNYGTGRRAPRKRDGVWMFDPLPERDPFYERFLDDFRFVLEVCGRTGLKLLPSLIDFSWCFEGTPVAGTEGIVKGGRYAVIRDAPLRRAFLDRILEPLLDCSLACSHSIYAWELVNEPEWSIRGFWKRGPHRNVSREEMQAFVSEGCRRIADRKGGDGRALFHSSVGFAHWKSLEKWDIPGLGITMPQFHYYAQGRRELPLWPPESGLCIVGEFATAPNRRWPELSRREDAQTPARRLECIEGKGYAAGFLWSARGKDPATQWSESVQREIAAFHGGSVERPVVRNG